MTLAALLLALLPTVSAAEVATAFAVTGSPQYHRGKSAAAALAAGSPLEAGDLVTTDGDSTAKILLKDKSVIDLSPHTSFRIEALETDRGEARADVRTDLGQVRASVNRRIARKGKFQMKTPSSVMAVRGTEFVVASAEATEAVTVLAGTVEVSDPSSKDKPVILERGRSLEVHFELARQKIWEVVRKAVHGTSAKNRKSQEIRTLDDPELALLLRRSRLVEKNFAQLTRLDSPAGGTATLAVAARAIPIPAELPRARGNSLTPSWRR